MGGIQHYTIDKSLITFANYSFQIYEVYIIVCNYINFNFAIKEYPGTNRYRIGCSHEKKSTKTQPSLLHSHIFTVSLISSKIFKNSNTIL